MHMAILTCGFGIGFPLIISVIKFFFLPYFTWRMVIEFYD